MPTREQTRLALKLVASRAAETAISRIGADADVLLFEVPQIVAYYSDGTAALAADHYDELRDEAAVSLRYVAEPVVNLREERLRRGILWAIDPLGGDEPNGALAKIRLGDVVQKESARPFRDTITVNQQRDPAAVGWQRNVSGSGCKFCKMLAGNGATYKQATAHFASHPNCSCTASPVFNGQAGPEASVIQYVASQRRRSESDQQRLREYMATLPE